MLTMNIFYQFFRVSQFLLFASPSMLLFSQSSALAENVNANKFDFNSNGFLDFGKEQDIYLLHVQSKYYQDADINLDGIINEEERINYEKKIIESTAPNAVDINMIREKKGSIPLDKANTIIYGVTKSKPLDLGGILIRRDYEDISVLAGPESFSEAPGAELSFSSDFLNNNDVFQARGAIFRPFGSNDTGKIPTSSNMVITGYKINPGITFEHISNSKKNRNDVDNLAFRLGAEVEVSGGKLFDTQYFRGDTVYETDFKFKRETFAFQAQWEPVKLEWGIGVKREFLDGAFEYRWRPILHAEGGVFLDSAGQTNISDNDAFFRFGPKIQFELSPTKKLKPFDRLGLNLQYDYLIGILGESVDTFEAGLFYQLDEVGHATLGLNYRVGDAGLTSEKVNTLSLGFSLKF